FASTYSIAAPARSASRRARRREPGERSTPTTRRAPRRDRLTVSVPRWHCRCTTSSPARSPSRSRSWATSGVIRAGSRTSSSIPYPAASCSAARSSQLARLSSNQLCAVLMATPYAATETWSTYFPSPRAALALPCPDEQTEGIRRRGHGPGWSAPGEAVQGQHRVRRGPRQGRHLRRAPVEEHLLRQRPLGGAMLGEPAEDLRRRLVLAGPGERQGEQARRRGPAHTVRTPRGPGGDPAARSRQLAPQVDQPRGRHQAVVAGRIQQGPRGVGPAPGPVALVAAGSERPLQQDGEGLGGPVQRRL